jgi:hypothetical protein
MPIRNPFARRPGSAIVQDENQRPDSTPGFEKVDTVGSKSTPVLSIRSQGRDNGEYKMSGMPTDASALPSLMASPLNLHSEGQVMTRRLWHLVTRPEELG